VSDVINGSSGTRKGAEIMKKINSTGTRQMALSRPTKRLRANVGRVLICLLLFNAVTSFAQAAGVEDQSHDHNSVAAPDQVPIVNTYCPVMPNMKTVKDIFSDFEGKRVYFCCVNCRASFDRDPEKYIGLLPQFGAIVPDKEHDRNGHTFELTPGAFVEPMGITTLSLLVLTVVVGLFRRRQPKLLLKWHKRLGIITLVSALIHAALVLIAH
jgi:hypothetical protein